MARSFGILAFLVTLTAVYALYSDVFDTLSGSLGTSAGLAVERVGTPLTPVSTEWSMTADVQNHATQGIGEFSAKVAVGDGTYSYLLSYPKDFNAALGYPKDGQDVTLAAKNPGTAPTPAEWLGCLHYSEGRSLHSNQKLMTILRDPMVCRVRAKGASESTAIAGVLWPAGNQQPLDGLPQRCAAEAVVWFEHLGTDSTRFVICMAVANHDTREGDVVVMERVGERLAIIATDTGTPGESIRLETNRGRTSDAVERYQMKQRWRADASARAAVLDRALQSIDDNTHKVSRDRIVRFERVERNGDQIRFVFRALNTSKLNDLIRPGTKAFAIDEHLFNLVRGMICYDPLTQALSEFQAEQETYVVTVLRETGSLARHRGALPARSCYSRE